MFPEIDAHGVIGNPRTAALVRSDGSIDWCCFPDFHSPSVFAALIDDESGGCFGVTLEDGTPAGQRYESRTNVLRTTIDSPAGTICITDFMPYFMDHGEMVVQNELLRSVECVDGEPTVQIEFDPRLDYARGDTTVESLDGCYRATDGNDVVTLQSTVDLEIAGSGTPGTHRCHDGEQFWLACRYGKSEPDPLDSDALRTKLDWTREYWRSWCRRGTYDGPWRDEMIRSSLVLKLLTYEPTDAIVAAATTSLPELQGGTRNWDYRYTWIRDSIFSAWAFYQLNYHGMGIEFLDLLERKLDPEQIPPMVDVRGNPIADEATLDHLAGYKGSQPVRIGNGAQEQIQWGSYGAMIDGEYFSHLNLGGIDSEAYEKFVKPAVDFVCENWSQPDHGIWEVRGEPQQFVTSKMWCWVVLDRGIKIATGQGYRDDVERWEPKRDEIKGEILEKGWSENLGAFKIAYENEALDASVLLMALVGFLPADHPKMERTIDAIADGLGTGPLLYRYDPGEVFSDPIESGDSVFTTCSFWLVVCLVELGRTDEAKELFEDLLEYSNHLGLFAEELDPDTGAQLGNFPQAYSHMGLINAAVELTDALD